MTVFGVMTAGLFPIIHLGRPWFAYWLFPYPNQRHLWVNFRSPLMWDVFAVSTYLIVSSIFLVVGMVPDAAALRDATAGWRRRLYALLAFGWHGTDEEWRHYARAYVYFAAFATPLVVSVHSVVSWDFAVSILPGWHSTLFPPYFVAGRDLLGRGDGRDAAHPAAPRAPPGGAGHDPPPGHARAAGPPDVPHRHLLLRARVHPGAARRARRRALDAHLPGHRALRAALLDHDHLQLRPAALPLPARVRTSAVALLAICILVNVGMWLERFVIIVTSLSHDRLPFTWRHLPSDASSSSGSRSGALGWFFFWFLLFVRILPAVSIAEMKEAAVQRWKPCG